MLSVSTMALAAMIGSACVPNANQACNVNSCTYDQANCIQAECAANGLKLPVKWSWCMPSGWLPEWKCKTSRSIRPGKLQKIRALDFAISNVTKEK